jgi:hypothetical protein
MLKEEIEKLLKRPVTLRMVEIWNGIGIPANKAEHLRNLWLSQANLPPITKREVKPMASPFRKCGCRQAKVDTGQ